MSELHRFLDEARGLLPAVVALRRRIQAKPETRDSSAADHRSRARETPRFEVEIAQGPSTSGLVMTLSGTTPGTQSGRTIEYRPWRLRTS